MSQGQATPVKPTPSGGRRLGLIGAALMTLIGLGLVAVLSFGGLRKPSSDLAQPFGEVPAFSLTERSGEPVTKADLLGKVWIVNFIFTQCVEECPLSVSRMAALHQQFAAEDHVRLMSISVNPTTDTPEVLTAYAERLGADPHRWLFLTGDREQIHRLSREGFHLGVFDLSPTGRTSDRGAIRGTVKRAASWIQNGLSPAVAMAHHPAHDPGQSSQQVVQHSARLVLVDRQARIRQYYDSKDVDALERLERDVTALLREP